MYEIKTILCAIAMTDNDNRILGRALREAKAHGADMHILHVLPAVSDIMVNSVAIMMGKDKFDKLIGEHLTEIESTIREEIEELKENVLTGDMADAKDRIADIHVLQGDPVIEILDATKRLDADMLVMGTHAKGITEHTFMGDVAHKVLKRARIPVLLIPAVKKH